jgi:hypothetical protein
MLIEFCCSVYILSALTDTISTTQCPATEKLLEDQRMTLASRDTKQQVHELIGRMSAGQVAAVVGQLTIFDPVSRAIASAPIDDEPETEDERRAVAESKAWIAAL